ncbi:glycosyltransferase family 39 protein [Gordonia rubripertincta]|uniref:ArnT family glycosyltransferase n=1 Tax=Gordonia rubripertincta TaxID=36822 RepID=UPI00117E6B5D|nr:glycosyltransferase family 39 protein [Gordonia rubripertincta]TSD96231.1 glycosyltransferase family 39 protein [Gordonia rubripertincta]
MTIATAERAPAVPDRTVDRPVRPRARFTPQQRWGTVLFVVLLAGYLAVGVYLYLVVGYINPDASSRVGNAAFTIWSRDPHLGAIGFVWNPLPSLVEIPLVELSAHWPFKRWPELRGVGFAGAVMSAFFMAGAGWQVRRIAIDYRCGAVLRWSAVAAFALNPMVVLYAGIGMSEAPFLFFLLWTCRRILLWINRFAIIDLVIAGVALGLAYLTRYEALPVAAAVTLGVFVVSTLRNRSRSRAGRAAWRAGVPFGVHDATIVALPVAFAFVLWAVCGWLLDGSAFAQFSSQYGNASQVAAAGIISVEDVGAGPLAQVIAGNLLGMQPLLPAVLAIVGWLALRSRRLDAAVVGVVFGSVLLFQMSAVILGSTFGWFRFYMAATPLVVVAVLVVSGNRSGEGESRLSRALIGGGVGESRLARSLSSGRSLRRPRIEGLSLLMAAVLVTSIPVTATSMLNPSLGKEEYGLRSAFWPDRYPPSGFWFYWFGEVSRNVAGWFDDQNLPEGSVLVDTFGISRIWLFSDRPEQFVIRSDFDFFSKLNQPAARGVQYILSPRPTGLGLLDAINVRYPTLWDDGAGIATLEMTVTSPSGTPQFRIYRIDGG